jgi:hypothetical protein
MKKMDLAAIKLELTKQLLNTKDKDILNHITAVFQTQPKDWWDELPAEIRASVERGLKQRANKESSPHVELIKKHKKVVSPTC